MRLCVQWSVSLFCLVPADYTLNVQLPSASWSKAGFPSIFTIGKQEYLISLPRRLNPAQRAVLRIQTIISIPRTSEFPRLELLFRCQSLLTLAQVGLIFPMSLASITCWNFPNLQLLSQWSLVDGPSLSKHASPSRHVGVVLAILLHSLNMVLLQCRILGQYVYNILSTFDQILHHSPAPSLDEEISRVYIQ